MALATQTRIEHRHPGQRSTSEVERLLQAEVKRLHEILGRLKIELDGIIGPGPDTSEPEGSLYCMEVVDLIERNQERLAEVTDALTRIEHGTYGTCEVCDRPIPAARLEAIPESRLCIGCASSASVQSTSLL